LLRISAKVEVTEELSSMNSLFGTTISKNIFTKIKKTNSVLPEVESAKMHCNKWYGKCMAERQLSLH
jgi:hypothetical protein